MPHTNSRPPRTNALSHVAHLVNTGDIRRAQREMRQLIGITDDRTFWVIKECARIIRDHPHDLARRKLAAFANGAPTEHYRALIAECTPGTRQSQPTDDPAPHWHQRNKHEAPRDHAPGHDAGRILNRAQRRQRGRASTADAATSDYIETRGGVAEGGPSDYHVIDYDLAALYALRGTPCLSCWAERSTHDNRGAGRRYDEGLCSNCRERGHSGIGAADVPAPCTAADLIRARCQHITTHMPNAAPGLIRDYWRNSARGVRAIIAQWVSEHPFTPADTGDIHRCGHCDANLSTVDPAGKTRDGFCSSCCRAAVAQPADQPQEAAAAEQAAAAFATFAAELAELAEQASRSQPGERLATLAEMAADLVEETDPCELATLAQELADRAAEQARRGDLAAEMTEAAAEQARRSDAPDLIELACRAAELAEMAEQTAAEGHAAEHPASHPTSELPAMPNQACETCSEPLRLRDVAHGSAICADCRSLVAETELVAA